MKSDNSTVQALGALCNLLVATSRSDSLQNLNFRILNNTIQLIGYDRAVLWDVDHAAISGFSGQSENVKHTRLSAQISNLIKQIEDPTRMQVVKLSEQNEWQEMLENTKNLSVLWVPLTVFGEVRSGLWLEIWSGEWDLDKVGEVLTVMADGYGAAFEKFLPKKRVTATTKTRKRILACVACAVLAFFFLYKIPLRLSAPCEVLPLKPLIVTAPLDGVLDKVLVKPGQVVKSGELLFSYDKRVATQELKAAKQRVEILAAQLERITAQSFNNREAQSEIVITKKRLEQEKLSLKLAEDTVAMLDVYAPRAGTVMISSPHEWNARPVNTGQRVLQILSERDTYLMIDLAEDDNTGIKKGMPVDIFLHAIPEKSFRADIDYISPYATPSLYGVPSFKVAADWKTTPKNINPGLKGTAILHGQPETLAYWIFRKPLATLRRMTGY